ncbi:efflux pump antibiotic resistance protein, putative [Metarhizium acridum CQMa 102]|uniref:Efflux pump antibiotic resistance protein, putative n=1 Tax=Metarhizium acridum (strain CQMa 102) TaxID=655827 RepID=E9EIH4_METAQ|nr:efflux pump antibiotic resistance protein, putative [Metarhizium acridum CQMa 102]EFY84288.1 efflux pump antibiotic resistance protein, putative [Metarhizium acridum CQMa 102]
MGHEAESVLASDPAGLPGVVKDEQHDGKLESNSQLLGDEEEDTSGHLHGWRLWIVAILISIVYFVVQVEISIVTTSLVDITQDIGGFQRAGWIMSAYLLGFGIGGGGSYALGSILLIQIVPAKEITNMASYSSISFVLATVLGPIIGGGICQHTTWRWIFLFNVPIGLCAVAMAMIGIPNGYPHHEAAEKRRRASTSEICSKIDLLGCTMLLLSTLAFASAFQEVNSQFSWDSAYFIVLVIVSLVILGLLLLWERRVSLQDGSREPVLPWRFIVRREMLGALLGLFLVGGSLGVTSFQLPQRFQLVNNLDAVNAGARLLPFGGASTVGGMLIARAYTKFKTPLVYIIIAGALLQVVGYALLGTMDASANIPPKLYGYEIIAGVGCGISYLSLFAAVPFAAEKRDHAVGLGISHQFRALGSALAIAVGVSIFNGHVMHSLKALGIPEPGKFVVTGARHRLPPELRDDVGRVLADGYNYQMLLLCGFGGAQIFAALLMWKRKQILPA